MAWTVPQTFATNESPLTSTKLNTNIRDNMRELWHEVAYTEFTSTVSSSSATPVDVVSAGAVTYNGYPILIEAFCPWFSIAAGGGALLLVGDGTSLGIILATGASSSYVARRLTPTAASHTYKIQINGTGGGATSTATAGVGGAGANMPGYIRILERGG